MRKVFGGEGGRVWEYGTCMYGSMRVWEDMGVSLASQTLVNQERGSGDSCAIFVQCWNSINTICHVVMHVFVITVYLDLGVGECSESVPS